MAWEMWLEFAVVAVLLGLFFYMFAFGSLTRLHRVYIILHIIFLIWPMFQFIARTTPGGRFQLYYISAAYTGLSLLGIGWLVLTIFLTGQSYVVRRRRLLVLALPALLSAAAVVFNPGGRFLKITESSGRLEFGPLYWTVIAQLILYLSVSLAILVYTVRKAGTRPHRKITVTAMNGLMGVAAFGIADRFVNGSGSTGLDGGYIPLLSAGLAAAALYMVHAIARQRAFDLIQIAQRDVMNTIPTGILVLDEHNVIVEANRMLRKLSHLRIGDKFNPDELAERMQIADKEAILAFFKAQQERKQDRFELEIAVYADSPRYIVVQSVPIRNQRRTPIGRLVSFQDVTELRLLIEETNAQNELLHERNIELMEIQEELSRANKKLEHMAVTDGLTGCFNRRYLLRQLEREVTVSMEYGTPFSISMFDIDLFKAINDNHGHLVGDTVLKGTVEAVREVLRAGDILARFGGEEFTVYLPHTTREQAALVAERIKEAVQHNEMNVGDAGLTVSVTISIGIVSIDDAAQAGKPEDVKKFIDKLFEEADAALYEAKYNGRNRIVNRKLA